MKYIFGVWDVATLVNERKQDWWHHSLKHFHQKSSECETPKPAGLSGLFRCLRPDLWPWWLLGWKAFKRPVASQIFEEFEGQRPELKVINSNNNDNSNSFIWKSRFSGFVPSPIPRIFHTDPADGLRRHVCEADGAHQGPHTDVDLWHVASLSVPWYALDLSFLDDWEQWVGWRWLFQTSCFCDTWQP